MFLSVLTEASRPSVEVANTDSMPANPTPSSSSTNNAAYAIGSLNAPVREYRFGISSCVQDVELENYRNVLTVAKSEEQNRKLVQADLAKTEDQLKVSESRREKLQDDLSSKCTEIEKLQTKIDELRSTLSETETERDKLTKKCNSYETQIAEQLDKISKLTAEGPCQGTVQKDLEQEVAQRKEKVEVLRNEKAGAEDVLDLKHREVETCRREIKKLTNELKVHKDLVRKLSSANKQHCQQKNELALENFELRQNYNEMNRRCTAAETILAAINREDPCLVYVVAILMGVVVLLVSLMSIYSEQS